MNAGFLAMRVWVILPATQMMSSGKSATIIYDMIVYRYPEETAKLIVDTQKRRLSWVKRECDLIFCISESTKKDAHDLLNIADKKLFVIYPGVTV